MARAATSASVTWSGPRKRACFACSRRWLKGRRRSSWGPFDWRRDTGSAGSTCATCSEPTRICPPVFGERKDLKLALGRQKETQEDAKEEAQEASEEDPLGAPTAGEVKGALL